MKVFWKIFTDAKSMKNSEVVLNKVLKKLNVSSVAKNIEPYYKGGYQCKFEIDISDYSWSDMVVIIISLSQLVGRGWAISNSIEEEIDLWTNECNISGITNIHVQCFNDALQ